MKFKLKLSQKNIFHYIYILILGVNFLIIFFLFGFINNYIYKTIAFDKDVANLNLGTTDNINITKFNTIIENIKTK